MSEWEALLLSPDRPEPEAFRRLVDADGPAVAALVVESYVNGAYHWASLGHTDPHTLERIRWVSDNARYIWDQVGVARRDVFLGLLRHAKRDSRLSPVLGAGATKAGGGPSWPELVDMLLDTALTRGHELWEWETTRDPETGLASGKRRPAGVRRLDPVQAVRATTLRERIRDGAASVAELKEGVQLCRDLFDQHLYTHITSILYAGDRLPSAIHRAIAAMSAPQEVGDGSVRSGWADIFTYNFDDFMGMALDDEGIPRVACAMRGDQLVGDPSPAAIEAGPDGVCQTVYHLHGYTPKKLFRITDVRYVFATSEYTDTYEGRQAPIFAKLEERLLLRPITIALYVGCSFDDERMNEVLEEAHRQYPGRYHYALLQWPLDRPYAKATLAELNQEDARFRPMGIRPLWFDEFREVPELLRAISGPR